MVGGLQQEAGLGEITIHAWIQPSICWNNSNSHTEYFSSSVQNSVVLITRIYSFCGKTIMLLFYVHCNIVLG